MATESVSCEADAVAQLELNPDEALARLCNAECMLKLALKALDDTSLGGEEWEISEALHGVKRLLDGCYVSLSNAFAFDSLPEMTR